MRYLSNSFSGQMVGNDELWIHRSSVAPEEVPNDVKSVIGHPDTARVVSEILGRRISFNRESITLEEGDELYVAQITGGRLPEGATTLPEGVSIVFHKYSIGSPYLIPKWEIWGSEVTVTTAPYGTAGGSPKITVSSDAETISDGMIDVHDVNGEVML